MRRLSHGNLQNLSNPLWLTSLTIGAKPMNNFTSIKPFPIWNIEQQQKRLGTTDKDRAKKRESLKYKRIKKEA